MTKESMARLLCWSKEEFRARENKLGKLVKQLQRLNQKRAQYENGDDIKRVKRQIQNILIDEEIY